MEHSLWCACHNCKKAVVEAEVILKMQIFRIKGRFRTKKTGLRPPVVFSLIVTRRFLHCCFYLLVRRWFHNWRLFCHYLFLIYSPFSDSKRRSLVIVTFPGSTDIFADRHSIVLQYIKSSSKCQKDKRRYQEMPQSREVNSGMLCKARSCMVLFVWCFLVL